MELPEEQIELAAKTAYGKVNLQEFARTDSPDNWNNLSPEKQFRYKKMMVIGAPFLQMMLSEPIPGDVSIAAKAAGIAQAKALAVINEYLRIRHAALLPQPADPRRLKIYYALAFSEGVSPVMDATVDRIIAALDSKS